MPDLPAATLRPPLFAFYFNGFTLNLSNSDVSALLTLDGQPTCKVNMSFTTAKTLRVRLSDLIEKLELVTDHNIMEANQVQTGLEKLQSPSADAVNA